MERAQALIRFIFSLIIVGGITAGLIWANCSGKETNAQKPIAEEEECRGGPATTAHGDVIEWDSTKNYPRKGEMVTFEGYVEMPNMTYLNGGTYMVNLLQDSTLEGRKVVLQVVEGDCENTMFPIPDAYDDGDLLIYDNAGNEIVQGDKIRVTGKVADDGALYMFFVKRIEKM